jgi:glycine dehydrogenase subunit 2
MIEPTESESKEECDLFIDAMQSIAEEAASNPDLVKTAPHSTRVRRLDEVGAARKPILRWDPSRQETDPNLAKHKAKHKNLEPTPVVPTA